MIAIEDAKVHLRKFDPDDVDALYSFRNDHIITSQLGGFSTGYSRSALVDWIAYHDGRSDEVLYAIADDDDTVIGHVGLYQIDFRVRKAEFAIVIGRHAMQGRGLGRAVSQWMIDYGFLELNLNKVTLTVLENNGRARRLYRSLGFAEEGVLRQDQYRNGAYLDVVMMSLLRSEWEAGRQ